MNNRILKLTQLSLFSSKPLNLRFFRSSRVQLLSSTGIVQKEKVMEHLKANPYFSRYADKLKNLKESSPEEFESKLKVLETEKNRLKELKSEDVSSNIPQSDETLDSILNLELIKEKSVEEITQLWKEYYSNKDCIYAVIPVDEFKDMQNKSTQFPNFIYPIPRAEGYEFFLQRWVDNTVHFTLLENYKKLGENAPTCLSLRHYTELIDRQEIVLMKGQPDLKVLSVHESQLLAMQVKMYYGLHSGLKFNFVRIFNNSPDTFRHMDLVIEFENYKKDVQEKKEYGTPV